MLDLLKETRRIDCKPAETPMDSTCKLGTIKDNAQIDRYMYQQLVGKLIYLSHTRSDISFSISMVSQFMNNLIKEHLTVVFRILR